MNRIIRKVLILPYRIYQKIKFRILIFWVKTIGLSNGKKRLRPLSNKKANNLLINMINSDKPFMISRYGGTEFSTLFTKKNKDEAIDELNRLSGFFPKDKKLIPKLRKTYIEASKKTNVLAIWLYRYYPKQKKSLVRSLPNLKKLVNLDDLHIYRNKWPKALEGKRVLIIHPFKTTIEHQYKNRKNISIIPAFKRLEVIKAVQSSRQEKTKFKDWFEALNSMKKEIDKNKNNFDIALIACGAYGLPLAAYVKEIGKQSIHVGGTLQLLFGIKGMRWEKVEKIKFPKNWIYPLPTDTPNNLNKIKDGGSYW